MNTQLASQADNQPENIISCSIIHYNDPHTNNLQSGNKISTENEFPATKWRLLTGTKLVLVFMERLSALQESLHQARRADNWSLPQTCSGQAETSWPGHLQ